MEDCSKEQLIDIAREELAEVTTQLRETRRILARDWEQMPTRERSAHSRRARELEARQKALLETIQMHSPG